MFRFFEDFLFCAEVSPYQICSLTEKNFRLGLPSSIDEVGCERHLRSVSSKISAVRDRPARGLYEESIGPRNAVVNVYGLQLNLAKVELVPCSESLEVYAFKIVLETSLAHL